MVVLRAATVVAIAAAFAAPAFAQQDVDTQVRDIAPGYEAPGTFDDDVEIERVTPFGDEPGAGRGEQDAPVNVFAGQTETYEPGLVGEALGAAKRSLFGAIRRNAEDQQ